jgi:hypothetical protein
VSECDIDGGAWFDGFVIVMCGVGKKKKANVGWT